LAFSDLVNRRRFIQVTLMIANIVVEPRTKLFDFGLVELWEHRELLYFFAWRDIKARYAQTALGASWAIVQPLATMIIFTVVFSYWAKMPSDGVPYPAFAYAALLPWTLLAKSLERSSNAVVAESNLIKKVYFPRLIIPIGATLAGLMDFIVAFVVLLGILLWYGIMPTWGVLTIPLFVAMTVLASLSVSLWLSALNVKYRDVAGTVPLLSQLWMYASPVVYPLSLVPPQWQALYSMNPMVGVIEGFRWALLGKAMPDPMVLIVSGGVTLLAFLGGIVFFKRTEATFSDVV
jgi:lipopolysaccharide transport system permease protein